VWSKITHRMELGKLWKLKLRGGQEPFGRLRLRQFMCWLEISHRKQRKFQLGLWNVPLARAVSVPLAPPCDWAAAADILHFVQRIPWGAAGRMRTTHQGPMDPWTMDGPRSNIQHSEYSNHQPALTLMSPPDRATSNVVARGWFLQSGDLNLNPRPRPASSGRQGGHPKCNTQQQLRRDCYGRVLQSPSCLLPPQLHCKFVKQ